MTETWILFNVLFLSLIYRFFGFWGYIGAVAGSLLANLFL